MLNFIRKYKKQKLKNAVKAQRIRKESAIVQNVENFRFTPCGFTYSDILKNRNKRR